MKRQSRLLSHLFVCVFALAFVPLLTLQALPAHASATSTNPITTQNSPLPYPSWWNGTPCDTSVIPTSVPLGASYRGMPACGPLNVPAADSKAVTFPGGWGQLEWQCVELSMRYLYLAYGIYAYPANGKDVVWNYSGALMQKIHNDGTPHQVPHPGDVLSYNATLTNPYGHTSIVTATHIDATGNGSIDILEQNGSPTGAGQLPVFNWTVSPAWTTVSGWLHYVGPIASPSKPASAASHSAYTFNANDHMLWQYKHGSFAPSSVVIVSNIVYAASLDSSLYALNVTNDTLLWRYKTGGPIRAAPAVINGVVYIGSSDAYLYALDARTGKLFWRYHAGGAIPGQAVVNSDLVYFSAQDNYVYAIQTTFGSLTWRYRISGPAATVTAPTLDLNIIYTGASDGHLYALNATDGALLWSYQIGAPVRSAPALNKGLLYISSGNAHMGVIDALNAQNGSLLWSYQAANAAFSTPVVIKTNLYASSSDGHIVALNIKDGTLLWRYLAPDKLQYTIITLLHETLYVGTDNHYLYALDAKGGKLLWSYQLSGFIESSPALAPTQP